ncbi:glycosyltransferase family 39 protein [bacterium SCSIO 12741]|nr:glycosyltransferase family 39 protein [bacterium SCSIO 12741]
MISSSWADKWNLKPLTALLILATIPRLVSMLFSQGYGMHDDHFLIIEAAQSWLDGKDYNAWLPQNRPDATPTGHSWFYVGLHYYFFMFLESIGITAPAAKMFLVRIIHGFYSLLLIPPFYRLVKKYGGEERAWNATLIMALLWFLPILSVRNLVELVCVPPLMWAFWLLLKEDKQPLKHVIFAGFLVGVAMALRFQIILYAGGIGLVLLFQKKIGKAVLFGIALLVALFFTQIGDLFLWGRPFAEITEYIMYNFRNSETYFNRPWYMYFGTLAGLLLPPLSVALMFGYGRMVRKYVMLAVPSLIFFAFHSYFPNKQERFIVPFIPFLILLGYLGWTEWIESPGRKEIWKKVHKFSWTMFWVLNGILLLAVTPASTKKSRVEVMTILGEQPNFNGAIVERSIEYSTFLLPVFYAHDTSWNSVFYITKSNYDEEAAIILNRPIDQRAKYLVMFEPDELDSRLVRFEQTFSAKLTPIAEVESSYLDRLLHWLNPNNDNEKGFIYKIEYQR